MNRPQHRWRARLAALATAARSWWDSSPWPATALAATSITPASGGSAISGRHGPRPDRDGGAWTALSGPVVTGAPPATSEQRHHHPDPERGFELRTGALGGAVGAAFTASAGTAPSPRPPPVVTATTIHHDARRDRQHRSDRCVSPLSGIQVARPAGSCPTPGLYLRRARSRAAGTLTMVAGARSSPSPSSQHVGGGRRRVRPAAEGEVGRPVRERAGSTTSSLSRSTPSPPRRQPQLHAHQPGGDGRRGG